MAHELEMKNGKAQMIYVGETPWHGLGKKLEVAPSSTEEAIKLAGLDWQIALEEMKLSVAIERGQSTHVRLSHVSGVNKAIDEITKMIEGIDARFEESAKVFRELASRKVRDSAQLREYVDAVYESAKRKQEQEGVKTFNEFLAKPHRSELPSPFSAEGGNMLAETKSKVFDEIARLFEFGRGNTNPAVAGTAWAAYNAVTEYNTWERGRSQDARLENLWMKVEGPSSRALPAAVDTFLRN